MAPRYYQLMPISCHFQDCEALLFVLTTCKQRYIKYPGFTFFTFYVKQYNKAVVTGSVHSTRVYLKTKEIQPNSESVISSDSFIRGAVNVWPYL